jgi:epoxyqueuosine reductase
MSAWHERAGDEGESQVTSDNGAQIIEKAKEIGATLAGIASVELLKESPSHEILSRFGTEIDGVYSFERIKDFNKIRWPTHVRSALVIAVSHPQDKPELDWSCASGNTPGNRLLVEINRELSAWIEGTLGIKTRRMPYWVEEGGIYLKDAAVLAGLGCIGRNNILITPGLGPRVRLRAMLLEAELTPTGPIDFDPCENCEGFCRKACPQDAFGRMVLSSVEAGMCALPGRDGLFSRAKCSIQMGHDLEDSGITVDEEFLSEMYPSGVETEGASQTKGRIMWCRQCELACPVGS